MRNHKRTKYYWAKKPPSKKQPKKPEKQNDIDFDDDDVFGDGEDGDSFFSDFENMPSNKSVNIRRNCIFLYGDIDSDVATSFNMKLRELEDKIQKSTEKFNISNHNAVIELHIQSDGGCMSSALSMLNTMKQIKLPIDTYVDGSCASAATFLLLAGRKRYMYEHSTILMHQLSTFMGGSFHNLKDEMKNCEMFMNKIKKIYERTTKLPVDKLDEILDHDLWWESDYCLENGIVDKVL